VFLNKYILGFSKHPKKCVFNQEISRNSHFTLRDNQYPLPIQKRFVCIFVKKRRKERRREKKRGEVRASASERNSESERNKERVCVRRFTYH